MDELLNKQIVKVIKDPDGNWIQFIDSEGKVYSYEAVGDCCASAYIAETEGFEILEAPVTSTEEESVSLWWSSMTACDATFYSINTRLGKAFIEMRVEHNGYYGGTLEFRNWEEKGGDVLFRLNENRLTTRLLNWSLFILKQCTDFLKKAIL